MRSRIATGPAAGPESVKTLIRSDPSVIEPGLSLLDFDCKTGPSGTIDAIGVDRTGRLAVVVVAPGDPAAALGRLLDGHLWVADQIDLLGRLYSERGVRVDRPARGFLLASSFTHADLRRLSLLSVEVVPCLAREVAAGDGSRLTIIEPAAPVFGLEPNDRPGPADTGTDHRQPFWPEGVLPSEDVVARRGIPVVTDAVEPPGNVAQAGGPVLDEDMPWPDTPEERFPWDIEAGSPAVPAPGLDVTGAEDDPLPAPALEPVPDEPAPAGAFETLTAEELKEFERFERQRRERGRRSP